MRSADSRGATVLCRLLVVVQTLCVSLKDTQTVSDCDAQKNMSMHYAGFLIIASYCTVSCDALIYLFPLYAYICKYVYIIF